MVRATGQAQTGYSQAAYPHVEASGAPEESEGRHLYRGTVQAAAQHRPVPLGGFRQEGFQLEKYQLHRPGI